MALDFRRSFRFAILLWYFLSLPTEMYLCVLISLCRSITAHPMTFLDWWWKTHKKLFSIKRWHTIWRVHTSTHQNKVESTQQKHVEISEIHQKNGMKKNTDTEMPTMHKSIFDCLSTNNFQTWWIFHSICGIFNRNFFPLPSHLTVQIYKYREHV